MQQHLRRYVSAAIIMAFVCGAFGMARAAERKPNVILLMADDMGYGDPGFNGNAIIHTPHLDAMAKDGLRFTRFYDASPVCSPTRGSCVTGRHPYRYGIYWANVGHMKPPEITLAELLRRVGYTTGHFGKWHLGTLTKTVHDANRGGPRDTKDYSPPQLNGFDVCFSTESKVPTWDPMLEPVHRKSKKLTWDCLRDGEASRPFGTRYWNEKGEMIKDNLTGDDSRVIMDRVIPFVEGAVKRKQPFFAVVWFHAPHLPVVAGPEYAKMYEKYDLYQRNYYGCITAMDDQVGRLRDKLKQLGVTDDTMIFFCSDNGPEGQAGSDPGTAGPYRGRKRSLYEGGVRVPGLWLWPGHVKPGTVTDYMASTSDYLPTILDAIGDKYPDDRPLDGISLMPMLEGKITRRPAPICFESRKDRAITSRQYKLLSHNNGKTYELYDLLADPAEQHDIAAAHADIVDRMSKPLDAWIASVQHSDAGGDYPK